MLKNAAIGILRLPNGRKSPLGEKEAIKMVALIIVDIIFYIPLAVIFSLADKYK